MSKPLTISNFPRAILHIDGDAFFASCEVALNPKLRGKPVITGAERGIASSMSYEAKARGVTRAMSLREIKRICPDAIILPSNYEAYSLFSIKMYNIVRRFTSFVEEYSIDECFADLTGMRRPLRMSYEKIAQTIKDSLDQELGMTFSVGLAPTKVLAKVGSKWKKPSGLTVIPGRLAHRYLRELKTEKIWGIGPQTSSYLANLGINTALDFAYKDEDWVKKNLTKPHFEIWQELRGKMVMGLDIDKKQSYKSISKTKTFTPASNNKEFVFSQLSKNIENACIKARRYDLAAKKIFFFLKTQNFKFRGYELKLDRPSAVPTEIIGAIRKFYDQVFDSKEEYRATGIFLVNLTDFKSAQLDLFGQVIKMDKISQIYGGVDKISAKYGKHTLFLGSSFKAMKRPQHKGSRNASISRKQLLFRGESFRKRVGMPMLGVVQ